MSEFTTWYHGIPVFTRYWFSGSVIVPLLVRFGFLKFATVILTYQGIQNFQLWRAITCVLIGGGWSLLMNLYFLYTYSRRLEEGEFQGKPSDYLFMLIFNWTCCVVAGLIVQMPVLSGAMVMTVIYVWCQKNKEVVVTFYFGTRFRAMFLPWILTALALVAGEALSEFIGILIGHLYYFLVFVYPRQLGGPSLLTTPLILRRWFPDHGDVRGFGSVPQRATPGAPPRTPRPFGHDWGRGNVLGGN